MIKKLIVILIMVYFCIPVYAETLYVNSSDGLRLHSSCDIEAETLTVLSYCSCVEVLENKNEWVKIEYKNLIGYAVKEYMIGHNPKDDMQYLGNWHITAYAETGYCCSNGNYPEVGYTIACNSLPFNSKIYIDGVGVRTVEDRGPTWLGDNWCDLYLGVIDDCVNWGSQYKDVWLIE